METLEADMLSREDEIIEERKKAIEQKPFTDPDVRSLFHVLCKKWDNDSMDVRFLARADYEKELTGAKADDPNAGGKKVIIRIPEDVETSEMEKILESVGKPENARITRREVESPKNELAGFLFRRGNKVLEQNMPYDSIKRAAKNALLSWKNGEKTLREAFRVEALRSELNEVKKTGDIRAIVDKEIEIADKIQMVVREYPHLDNSQHPAEMIQNKKINCRGASLLGGQILSDIGIKYLVGDLPRHSILVLCLSDGTLEWCDMRAPQYNDFITDEMVTGISKTGAKLSLKDAVAYSKDPTPDGLMFDIVGDEYRKKLSWVKKGQRQFLTLFPPELGSQMQVLNGVAFELVDLGINEIDETKKKTYFRQAVEACKLSTAYEPKYEYAYNTMGEALCKLGQYEEALKAYQSSREVNSMNTPCHYGLGEANFALGRKKEALASYKKYLEIADEKSENDWMIKNAKERIEELK